MKLRSPVSVVVGSAVALVLAACSSGSDSQFPGATNSSGAIGNGASQGGLSGGSNNSPGDGGLGGLAACATSTASGALAPVDLVLMFDKSGSMDQVPSGSSMSKFEAVKAGLLTFAADPSSTGMTAQLTFFGQGSGTAFCSASTYTSNVTVNSTALPDTTALAGGFSGVTPDGSTPTQAAIDGAIAQAQTIAAAHPDHKVAIVMLTDGLPQGCSDDSNITPASNDAQAAFSAATSIPTYVIGVGDLKTNLDTLAAAGGTSSAYILTDTNTATTNTELIAALGSIRGKTASCNFALPAPPTGQTLNVDAVNVQYTDTSGTTQTLTYDQNCTSGDGWHYDDATNPKEIDLCANTCNTVKTQATGKVSIAFGCATQGGVPR
jgi:hypothetical protein